MVTPKLTRQFSDTSPKSSQKRSKRQSRFPIRSYRQQVVESALDRPSGNISHGKKRMTQEKTSIFQTRHFAKKVEKRQTRLFNGNYRQPVVKEALCEPNSTNSYYENTFDERRK